MKIVTLLPSATEIACFLGLADQLVAISHECDFPDEVTTLPRITRSRIPSELSPADTDSAVVEAVQDEMPLYHVNGDLLAELKPDLILTQGICDVCAVNVDTVQQSLVQLPDAVANHAHILSLSGTNVAGILRDIQLVARATNTEQVARPLLDAWQQQWDNLQDALPANRPDVLMLEWPDPPFYGGHWVPEMVEVAGGNDVFGRNGLPSGRCTWSEIAARDPEYLLVIACGHNLDQNITFARDLYKKPEASHLRAVQHHKVWACDANSYFSRPGPRILQGAAILQRIFSHPVEHMPGAQRVYSD